LSSCFSFCVWNQVAAITFLSLLDCLFFFGFFEKSKEKGLIIDFGLERNRKQCKTNDVLVEQKLRSFWSCFLQINANSKMRSFLLFHFQAPFGITADNMIHTIIPI